MRRLLPLVMLILFGCSLDPLLVDYATDGIVSHDREATPSSPSVAPAIDRAFEPLLVADVQTYLEYRSVLLPATHHRQVVGTDDHVPRGNFLLTSSMMNRVPQYAVWTNQSASTCLTSCVTPLTVARILIATPFRSCRAAYARSNVRHHSLTQNRHVGAWEPRSSRVIAT